MSIRATVVRFHSNGEVTVRDDEDGHEHRLQMKVVASGDPDDRVVQIELHVTLGTLGEET